MATNQKGRLPTWEQRSKVVKEKCAVRGCDGTVTRTERPMMMSERDRIDFFGMDLKRFPITKKPGAPRDAVWFETRGTADVTIWGCFQEAGQYAGILDKPVAFVFNEVLCVVRPGADTDKLWRGWWKKAYGETYEQSFRKR